jgi:hypothetical protein
MAEETVDTVIKECKLKPKNGCVTPGLLLDGAHDWNHLLHIHLVQDYGLDTDVKLLYSLTVKKHHFRWHNIWLQLMVTGLSSLLECVK